MRRFSGNFPLGSQTGGSTVCMFWVYILSIFCSVNTAQYDLFSARLLVNYTELATGNLISKEISGRFGVTSPTATEVIIFFLFNKKYKKIRNLDWISIHHTL